MPRPARPWFRFYVEAVHDRKLRRLKPETRWLFVACLAAARQSPEPGWLLIGANDPMHVDDLVDFAAMPSKQVEQGTTALVGCGVLGYSTERSAWFVPNWNERQFESDNVTERTAKHRSSEQRRNVPTNGVTAPVGTPPETETETENIKSSNASTRRSCAVDEKTIAVVLERYADLQHQRTGGPRSNPAAWRSTVIAQARADHLERIRTWLDTFDVTPDRIAAALVDGRAPADWNHHRKAAAS